MSCKPLSTRIKEIEEIERKHAGLTGNVKECCIYKVHKQLRDINEKAYEPVLLAIGPNNDQCMVGQGFMEEHKLHYLRQMLKRTKRSVETYIMALRKLEEKARQYYAKCVNQTQSCLGRNDAFAEMMLLDGCFIIELFHRYEFYKKGRGPKGDPIFQMKWVLPRIARDLLLFENQLPFFVLAELFCMSESNESRNLGEHIVHIEEKDGIRDERSTSTDEIILKQCLIDRALGFFSTFLPFQGNVNNSTKRITDLLDLTHEARNPSLPVMIRERLELGFRFKNAKFEHLLSLIHASICISILDTEIDHAKECQEAGVKFKMAKLFKHPFGLICKAVASLRAKEESIDFASDREPLIGASLIEEPLDVAVTGASLIEEPLVGASLTTESLDGASFFEEPLVGASLSDEPLAGASLSKEPLLGASLFEDPLDVAVTVSGVSIIEEPIAVAVKGASLFEDPLDVDAIVRGANMIEEPAAIAVRENEHRNIHGATELEEAGIKFKKAKEGNAFSIKFNNGLMELSPLSIEDETETYLRNLIAYEQYYEQENGFNYVTNFVCFMDDLINSPKDVELLRRSGIIRNYLGDDEFVSTMVNRLCHNITISPKSSIYARTAVDLNKYCSTNWNQLMAQLRHDYFNSPWALVSSLAAILLLLLTITQTIFSIIP